MPLFHRHLLALNNMAAASAASLVCLTGGGATGWHRRHLFDVLARLHISVTAQLDMPSCSWLTTTVSVVLLSSLLPQLTSRLAGVLLPRLRMRRRRGRLRG